VDSLLVDWLAATPQPGPITDEHARSRYVMNRKIKIQGTKPWTETSASLVPAESNIRNAYFKISSLQSALNYKKPSIAVFIATNSTQLILTQLASW